MLLLKEIVLQPHSFVKTLANTSIDKLNFFYNIKPLEKISKKGLGVKILITDCLCKYTIILCSRSRNVILWAIIIEIRKCNFLQEDRCLLDLHYSPFPNKRAAKHITKRISHKRSAEHINEISNFS